MNIMMFLVILKYFLSIPLKIIHFEWKFILKIYNFLCLFYLKANKNIIYMLAFKHQRLFILLFMYIHYVQKNDVTSLGNYFIFLMPNSRKTYEDWIEGEN